MKSLLTTRASEVMALASPKGGAKAPLPNVVKTLLLLSAISSSLLLAEGLEYKGNVAVELAYLDHDMPNKYDSVSALHLDAEVKYGWESSVVVINLKGVYDSEDTNRRYLDFNDLYYKRKFESSDILIGRNTRFWGALEFYNLTDVFNTKDRLDDPFDFDSKLGAWSVAYTHYLGDDELSLIIKTHEEKQPMQDASSPYNYYPLPYNDDLITQESRDRPTVYLRYSGSLDATQLDYAFIYQNGYDAQRYMSLIDNNLRQNAYLVDKFLAYSTLVAGSTIYKGEFSYTLSDDELVSDYYELGLGLEHTLYGIWEQTDLGLLVEYYKYESEDETKYGAEEFGKLFANDLTLGFRWAVNDTQSSELLGGVDIDLDNEEKIYFVSYKTRIYDSFKLELSYQHLSPKDDSSFESLDRARVEFGYYF